MSVIDPKNIEALTERVSFRLTKKEKTLLSKHCKRNKIKQSALLRENAVKYLNSFQAS